MMSQRPAAPGALRAASPVSATCLLTAVVMLLCAAFVLSGCSLLGDDAGNLSLTRDRDVYAPGDTVELMLANGTDQTVGYNLCLSQLQVRDETQSPVRGRVDWLPVDPVRACILIVRSLGPGESDTYPYALPDTLSAPNIYRLQTMVTVRPGEDQRTLHIRPFTVSKGD